MPLIPLRVTFPGAASWCVSLRVSSRAAGLPGFRGQLSNYGRRILLLFVEIVTQEVSNSDFLSCSADWSDMFTKLKSLNIHH